ncbi:hypothetical protein AAC387_Pa09g2281 [Persea americana]
MTVRFKFRSSVDFDSIDINGRSSISVRDLRVKIVQHKNLKICDDFDLVISDADTSAVYEDDDFPVPDGSSVIIKRVPARRSAPSDLLCINSMKGMVTKSADYIDPIGCTPTANMELENFDDFGADLCPAPETSLDSDIDIGKVNCSSSGKKDEAVPRGSLSSTPKGPKIELSDFSEAISRGILRRHCDKDYGAEGEKSQPEQQNKKDQKTLNEEVDTSTPTLLNVDLPAELRCSLCNSIFKEAVMIPCCQHSFCDKCIHSVLVKKEKCPKCASTKCQVEDLLPNVSLRQAIEHFLESQVLISGSDNILPKYAPDGESGIQAKEVSCAVSIRQREPQLPHSPSATGKGSNQVMTDTAWESRIRNHGVASGTGSRIIHLNTSAKSAPSLHKIKQVNGIDEKDLAICPEYFENAQERLELTGDFQKANSTSIKKKGLWVNNSDGNGNFIPSRYKKGDRTCYMCGSPDHLVRDCPAAACPYPMLQTAETVFPGGNLAYGPAYWQGASLPHVRPFGNLYGAPGMMPFDPTMVPVTPFAVPPYMPSMYAGMPVPCGFMRMGGMVPPMLGGQERPLSRSEFMELQDKERKRKFLNENLDRGQTYDADDYSSEGYHYNEPQRRSSDRKLHSDKGEFKNHSDNDESWRPQMKQSRNMRSGSYSHQRSDFDSDEEDVRSIGWKHVKDCHFSVTGRDVERSMGTTGLIALSATVERSMGTNGEIVLKNMMKDMSFVAMILAGRIIITGIGWRPLTAGEELKQMPKGIAENIMVSQKQVWNPVLPVIKEGRGR